jgi:nucleoside diphosphate kinase
LLVKGDNVVSKLLNLVGLKTNPALCEEDTIRYIYGDHIPEELGEGLEYFRNATHRPTNTNEAIDDLEKFKDLI